MVEQLSEPNYRYVSKASPCFNRDPVGDLSRRPRKDYPKETSPPPHAHTGGFAITETYILNLNLRFFVITHDVGNYEGL
jgi:hypothetical protein